MCILLAEDQYGSSLRARELIYNNVGTITGSIGKGITCDCNFIASNIKADNETRLAAVETKVANIGNSEHTHTTFDNDVTVNGTLTASNVKSDNETRLATLETKVANKADSTHRVDDKSPQ